MYLLYTQAFFCNLLFIKHLYRSEQISDMYRILLIPSELSNISELLKVLRKEKDFFPEFKNGKCYHFYNLEQIDIIVAI